MKVLIIGAGIAGLSMARALKKYNINATIIEKESSLSQAGVGIALPANATKALEYLGLKKEVFKYSHKVNEIIYSKPSEKILSKASLEEGNLGYSEFVALLRKDLINVLYSEEFNITFDCFVEFFEDRGQKVFTKFNNGKDNLWDLIIAADGINSSMRNFAFLNAQPKVFNIKTWRFLADLDTKSIEPKYYLGRDTAFMIYPVSKSKVYCYAHQCNADKTNTDLEDTFESYSATVTNIIAKTSKEDIIYGHLKSVNDIEFYKGRVAFIGDSSSACSPLLQQGAASAFEDVITLASKLSCNSIDDALKEYEIARRERVSWIVEKSDSPIERIQNGLTAVMMLLRNLLIKKKGPINVQCWRKLFERDPIDSL